MPSSERTVSNIDPKVLNKIKKCLALAGSDNPNEAATAMRQAHALMEKHGVSSHEITMADIGESTVKSKTMARDKPAQWEARLAAMVGRAFGCQMLVKRADVATLDAFYMTTLAGGTLTFDWTHPRTGAAATCAFPGRASNRDRDRSRGGAGLGMSQSRASAGTCNPGSCSTRSGVSSSRSSNDMSRPLSVAVCISSWFASSKDCCRSRMMLAIFSRTAFLIAVSVRAIIRAALRARFPVS